MYSGDNIRTFIHYYFEFSFDCGVMSYLHGKQKLLGTPTCSTCVKIQCRMIASYEIVVFSSVSLNDINKILLLLVLAC